MYKRQGSFFQILRDALVRTVKIVFVVGQIVLWILLFLISAFLEVVLRTFEVLQLVEYRDMTQEELPAEFESSRVVLNGKPNASVIALRNKYVSFEMTIRMPYKEQTKP